MIEPISKKGQNMRISINPVSPYPGSANAKLPVSVADVKTQGRITHSTEDALIARYIQTATELLEQWCRRSFIQQQVTLWMDAVDESGWLPFRVFFDGSCVIWLPRPKIISITSIKFYGEDDVAETVDPSVYQFDPDLGRVVPKAGEEWPDVSQRMIRAVEIVSQNGFGSTPADIPVMLKQAIILFTLYMYNNPSASCCDCEDIPGSVKMLAKGFRRAKIGEPVAGIQWAKKVVYSGSLRGGY